MMFFVPITHIPRVESYVPPFFETTEIKCIFTIIAIENSCLAKTKTKKKR